MKTILESIQPIVNDSHFVSIDDKAVDAFVESIRKEETELSEFDKAPLIPNPSDERYIGFTIVYNTINFCYWGDPKWTIEIDSKKYDGSYALTQAFIRGLKEGYDLLNPKYLENLKDTDLAEVLRGNVEIPLFKERAILLRNLGKIMNERFDGLWLNIIKKGKYDAEGIVEVLINNFPSIFRDEIMVNGEMVKFYKRAQLVPAFINHDLSKTGAVSIKIKGIENLTAFADYKVPQVLRKLEILKYSEDLTQKIDNLVQLRSGSLEEVEIRANTIEAIDRAAKKAKRKFPNITASRIDGIVWFRGQVKSPRDKPYHRTKTIWY